MEMAPSCVFLRSPARASDAGVSYPAEGRKVYTYDRIFIRDKWKWTLQYMLRDICTILPIIVVYPFLQKYHIHGIIVCAVKG